VLALVLPLVQISAGTPVCVPESVSVGPGLSEQWAPVGAPVGAPVVALVGAPVVALVGAPVVAPVGTPVDAPVGAAVGAPVVALACPPAGPLARADFRSAGPNVNQM
jgi:hypothetical protein